MAHYQVPITTTPVDLKAGTGALPANTLTEGSEWSITNTEGGPVRFVKAAAAPTDRRHGRLMINSDVWLTTIGADSVWFWAVDDTASLSIDSID